MSALPACLRESSGAVLLAVKVTPRASRNEIGGLHGDVLKIKVTAPPVDSAANEAVLELLAEKLNCPRNALQLVRGGTSRQKVISIAGIPAQSLAKKLGL